MKLNTTTHLKSETKVKLKQYKVFNTKVFIQSLLAVLPNELLSKNEREKTYRKHLVEKF